MSSRRDVLKTLAALAGVCAVPTIAEASPALLAAPGTVKPGDWTDDDVLAHRSSDWSQWRGLHEA